MINRLAAVLLAAAQLGLATAVFADTVVSGEVRGHWTVEGSPYIVIGNISLNRNDTLHIDPGVVVSFGQRTQFDVYGVLRAVGTSDDSIRFTSGGRRAGDWRWIKFTGIRANGSLMRFCSVEFTEWGIHIIDCNAVISNSRIVSGLNWGVKIENSQAQVLDCSISAIDGYGIVADTRSRCYLRRNVIFACSQSGIGITGNAFPVVDGNLIFAVQRQGIYLSSAGICSLKNNVIRDCAERGFYVYQSSGQIIQRNVVYNCGGDYSLYLYHSPNANLFNNTVYQNDRTGIGFVSSGGQLIGNIVALNGVDGVYAQNAQVSVGYNDVWQNIRNNFSGLNPTQTDISENPDLVNPGLGDFTPREGSPVIDRGDPRFTDLDGTRSDIGAYFFNQNHPPEITSYSPEVLERAPGDQELLFSVTVRDPDGHGFLVKWYVNEVHLANGLEFRHTFRRDGRYSVRVTADDGYYLGTASHEWAFDVEGSSAPVKPPAAGEFRLSEIYPNPFNAQALFEVDLHKSENVLIGLYDLSGRMTARIHNGRLAAGRHLFAIRASEFPVGTYYLRVASEDRVAIRKAVLIK